MKSITIAKNTIKEVLRAQVLYLIIFLALGMMAFSTVLYYLSMRQDVKIMKDVGLGMISIFGVIITIFIGSSMLFKEIDKKTIYTVLSKPVDRNTFLIGKFLGLSSVLFIITAGLTLAFYLILLLKDVPFDSLFLLSILFSYFEMIFLTAVTIFFSTLTSPIITIFSTLVIFLVGHSVDSINSFISKLDSGFASYVLKGIFYLLPNLEALNLKNQVVYNVGLDPNYALLIVLYVFIYIALLLFISSITFKNKDF